MKASTRKWVPMLAMASSVLLGAIPASTGNGGGDIDICKQVSAEQLKQLYHKPLYPTASTDACFWSEKPGGMADMDIQVHDVNGPLRDYFDESFGPKAKLVKISDLGDEGLMSVGEGTLGVVVIRKGKQVLQSAVTFLDIEPGSEQQTVLWDIYRKILEQM